MEKRRTVTRRGLSLNGLFWRYLLSTGALLGLLCLAGMFLFQLAINWGMILPANTAAKNLEETVSALQEQETFDPAAIPHYYRWALLDKTGVFVETNMTDRQQTMARREQAGDSFRLGLVYPNYHRAVSLPGGKTCLLQYDYSVQYADPVLQASLPDFQIMYLTALGLLLLAAAFLRTRRYTRILRRDAETVALACETVRRRCLEEPLPEQARVRELQAALDAIGTLRQELTASLKEQWAAEQQKNEALAALTHDLKTPLTIIGGNAELLCEDDLSQTQRQSVEAILRSARHAGDYVQRLRAVAAGEGVHAERTPVPLDRLAARCGDIGRDLCAAQGLPMVFYCEPDPLPPMKVSADQAAILRAAENLWDNAVRYTPAGGTVTFAARVEEARFILTVQDSGPGFSPQALTQAGRTFYTEDASRPQEGHMGMGLYFAAQTAKRHGGGLWLENTPSGGRASLWVPLPQNMK